MDVDMDLLIRIAPAKDSSDAGKDQVQTVRCRIERANWQPLHVFFDGAVRKAGLQVPVDESIVTTKLNMPLWSYMLQALKTPLALPCTLSTNGNLLTLIMRNADTKQPIGSRSKGSLCAQNHS